MKTLILFAVIVLLFVAVTVDYDLMGHQGCRYLRPVPLHPRTLACAARP